MFKLILKLVSMLLLIVACQPQPTATPLPTSTPLPIFEYQSPTKLPEDNVATASAATTTAENQAAEDEPTLDPTAVARGANNWERLECASCHGENGEGGTAPPLTGLELTQAEFIDWMRTGGTLGSDHLFSADRLSDNGSRTLYQFVLSLGAESE